jgi:transposase
MSPSRQIAELQAQVAALLAQVTALQGQVAALQAENTRLRSENAALREENAALRARLRGREKPPRNEAGEGATATPAPPPPRKPRSGRKRGGQPGHEPSHRQLLPVEQVDAVVPVKPAACGACGTRLSGDDPNPARHQVTELPRPEPIVTEYQRHALTCRCCGEVTRPDLPPGVPLGAFGPRLQAVVAICSGLYRLSKRQTQELLHDLFGVEMSLGSVPQCERVVSDALAAPVEDAHAYVQQQPSANVDETTWYEGHVKAYLWSMVTSFVTVFMIAAHRSSQVARTLLGTFAGVLVTDRLTTYDFWPLKKHQFCWAHLERRFREFLDCGEEARRIGTALLADVTLMWSLWHDVRDGPMTRASFRARMRPVQKRIHELLEQGTSCPHTEVAGTCKHLREREAALWTFVRVEGVPPTNNAAEQSLRHGVIWRRTSFGTDSRGGTRFVERILTVVQSLRQQRRNVLDFVTEACHAVLTGAPLPSLLPPASDRGDAAAAA